MSHFTSRIALSAATLSLVLVTSACQPTMTTTTTTTTTNPATNTAPAANVKEFSMDSFMEMKEDGSRIAGFSVKEIAVKKGDKVRILVKNIKGTHDWVLDEFGVKSETPEGQVTTIEFTADKVGEFKYYCSKYNHRSLGQEGTLKVTE